MLRRFELPPTVHDHAHYRVWNRRGYDMNLWSEKKIQEKLNYMHRNLVKRGLVAEPGDWPWSRRGGEILLSGRQFCFGDGSGALSCRGERSHRDNWDADIKVNVCATRAGRRVCSGPEAGEGRFLLVPPRHFFEFTFPSPPGRGWTATRVLISRRGPGLRPPKGYQCAGRRARYGPQAGEGSLPVVPL
jgi:hypothetical protein